jgi:hypothetical protein
MINQILHKLFDPEYFKKYAHLLTQEEHFKDDFLAWDIFLHLQDYYASNTQPIKPEQLCLIHASLGKLGMSERKQKPIQERYLEIAAQKDEQPVDYYLAKLNKQHIILGLTNELADIAAGDSDKDVVGVIDSYRSKLTNQASEQEVLALPSVDEFMKNVGGVETWHWPLPKLSETLHGFGAGRSCLIFGRSNVGKSSFTLFCIRSFLEQGARVLDLSIMEDPFVRRMPRLLQTMTGLDYTKTLENRQRLYQKFLDKYGDNYLFRYDPALNIAKIGKLAERFKPDIVVVDNFSKVNRFSKQEINHAKALGLILADLKGLAETHGFGVIPVCQAAASASGDPRAAKPEGKMPVETLTMAHIADSRVDVPGELEMAIGIAASNTSERIMYLNIVKNKLGAETRIPLFVDKATNQWKAD